MLDCGDCMEMNDESVRAMQHCGWIPQSKWRSAGFPCAVEWGVKEVPVCPGYMLLLPQVQEAQRAAFWTEKGLLRERYEGVEPTGVLMDCVEHLSSAVQDVETHILNESSEASKNGIR
jgi:hypothetical protein